MITNGFAAGRSGEVTLDVIFADINGNITTSTYIAIDTTGSEGSIVFINSSDETQYSPYIFFGYNPIAAKKVLTSATVNGVSYETTATGLTWYGSVQNA